VSIVGRELVVTNIVMRIIQIGKYNDKQLQLPEEGIRDNFRNALYVIYRITSSMDNEQYNGGIMNQIFSQIFRES
jgi:hypothetical protein